MAYDLTLSVGFLGDATSLFQSIDTFSNTLKSKPLVIPASLSTDRTSDASAREVQDALQNRARAIDTMTTKTATYRDELGNIVKLELEATKVWSDALGNTFTKTEALSGATTEIGKGWTLISKEVGKIDYKKLAEEAQKVREKVDGMAEGAKKFLASSKNMSGPAVEDAKKIAEAVLRAKTRYDEFMAAGDMASAGKAAMGVQNLTNKLQIAESATKQAANANKSWGASLAGAMKQTLAYATSLGLLRQAQRLLADGIRYIIDLNKEMIAIQVLQVEGAQTPEEINSLAQSFNNLAKEMGATTIEVAQGSVEWLRQGKTIAQTEELLVATSMMAKLGNMNLADSTESLTSVLNSFKLEAEDAVGIVDKLVAVDNVAATSTKELAVALRYVAAVASEAGVTIEQLVSYIAVISQTTRLNAEQIGQSLKTIFTRMQDIQKGGLDEEGMGINNVEIALKRVDITLRDSTTSFRDFGGVLEELAGKWDTLNEIEQANIGKAIAGVRQANMFRILMTNMNEALELQAVQYNSAGLAADRYQIYLEGVEAAQNKLKASMEALWQQGIESETIKNAIDLATAIVDLIGDIGGLNTILKMVGVTLIALRLSALISTWTTLGSVISKTSVEFVVAAARAILFGTATTTAAGGVTLLSGGLNLVIPLLVGLVAWFGFATTKAEETAQAIEDAVPTFESLRGEISSLTSKTENISSLKDEFEELSAVTEKTVDQQNKFYDVQNKLLALVPALGGALNSEGNFIITNTEAVDNYIIALNNELEAKKRLAIWVLENETMPAAKKAAYDADVEFTAQQIKIDNAKKYLEELDALRDRSNKLPDNKMTKYFDLDTGEEVFASLADTYKYFSDFVNDGTTALSGLREEYNVAQTSAGTLEAQLATLVDTEDTLADSTTEAGDATAYFYNGFDDARSKLENIKSGYEDVSSAVATYGSNSAEAFDALMKALPFGEEFNDYLNEQGVNLEKLGGVYSTTIQKMREWVIAGTEGTPEIRTAILALLNDTQAAFATYTNNNITLTKAQFETISSNMADTLYNSATYAGIILTDINGVALNTSADIQSALLKGLLTFTEVSKQMANQTVVDMAKIAEQIGKLFSFATGTSGMYSPPPALTYSSSGGANAAAEAEKKAIEGQIKALEKKKDALKDTLDQFKDYITAQKESLRLAKEEKEFSDELMKKNLSLAKLKTNIAILALDDSEEARAQRIEMEEDAASLEEDISKDKEDRVYDLKIEALDRAEKAFEDNINRQMKLLDSQIEQFRDQMAVIDENTKSVVGLGKQIYQYGQAATLSINSVIAKLAEQGIKIDATNGKIRTMIQNWISQGLTIEQVTQKAARYYQLMQRLLSMGINPNNPSQNWMFQESGVMPYHNGGVVENHHSGAPDFAGGKQSNEVFAKLLTGELVATEGQMNNFMKNILPSIASRPMGVPTSSTKGGIEVNMPITVMGNMDDSVLPKMETMIKQTITKLNDNLINRGFTRTATDFSV